MKDSKDKIKKDYLVISSIPNIRHFKALLKLIFKDWNYEEAGVKDHTYLRFFTKKKDARMYEETGYSVELTEGLNKIRSIIPYLFNAFLFKHLDIRYPQYAT